jgi:hypothetical protein
MRHPHPEHPGGGEGGGAHHGAPQAAPAHVAEAQPASHAQAGAPPAAHRAAPEHAHHAHHPHAAHRHDDTEHVGLVSLDGADLEDAAAGMRRWADELDAIAARTGTIRGALGIASIQAGVDDIVGRQVAELTGLAGELRDEASELTVRAQLAQDDLPAPTAAAAAAGTGGTPAPESPTTAAQPGEEGLLARIVDALDGPDDPRPHGS